MKAKKVVRKRLLESARILKDEQFCDLVAWTKDFNNGFEITVERSKYADWVAQFSINGRNCGLLFLGDGNCSPFYDFT